MVPVCQKRPWICRVLTIVVGLALFTLGVRLGELWGLVLMIVGLVPAVTGIADVSLFAEIREDRARRRSPRRGPAAAAAAQPPRLS